MNERVKVAWSNARERWGAIEKKQKIQIGVIAGLILISIIVAVFLLTRTKYEKLPLPDITTLTNTEAALSANSIPYKRMDTGYGLLIPEKYMNDAKSVVITSGAPSVEEFKFSDALDSFSMSTTGTVVDETLKRVQESNVKQQIIRINGVTAVELSVDLPKSTNYFENAEGIGKASAQVGTSRTFGRQEGEMIASIVAASFKHLSKENVYVTDTQGNVLYAGVDSENYQDEQMAQLEYINVVKNEKTRAIQQLLALTADDVNVVFNPDIDFTESARESVTVTNPVDGGGDTGLVDHESSEQSQGSNTNPQAEPGVQANNNEVPDYQVEDETNSSVSQKNKDTQYLYNSEKVTSSQNGYGKINPETSSIAVIRVRNKVYNETTITPETLGGLTWAQFKEANSNSSTIENEEGIVENVRLAANLANNANVSVITYERPVFVDGQVKPVPWQTIAMLVILGILLILLTYGIIKKTQPDEITEVEPELTVEDMLVSSQLDEEKEAQQKEMDKLREIEFAEDSEIKKLISKFIDDKPEAVAQLLRNWINEDWE
ncbi:MAG: hypothetical protein LBM16_03210 [Clostridiales bacterium]|jgi:flagellar M-ring protein FliF|nr:hypothetical protein [Clostridiales bacterium]